MYTQVQAEENLRQLEQISAFSLTSPREQEMETECKARCARINHMADTSKVSMWLGVTKTHIYVLFFFFLAEATITGKLFQYITAVSGTTIETISILDTVVFQQDGVVREYLNNRFLKRWVELWTACSSDLALLDFFA